MFTVQAPDEYFKYKSWNELEGLPYWGFFGMYSGGGYVAELGTDLDYASNVINDIQSNKWIDNHTRAVFVEFNLYNPNNNLWGVCLYLLEFLQTGGKFS